MSGFERDVRIAVGIGHNGGRQVQRRRERLNAVGGDTENRANDRLRLANRGRQRSRQDDSEKSGAHIPGIRTALKRNAEASLDLIFHRAVGRSLESGPHPADVPNFGSHLDLEVVDKTQAHSGDESDLIAMIGIRRDFVVVRSAVRIGEFVPGVDRSDMAVLQAARQVAVRKKPCDARP